MRSFIYLIVNKNTIYTKSKSKHMLNIYQRASFIVT